MRKLLLFVVLATFAVVAMPQIAPAVTPRCLGRRATIVGTARADLIRGTARADVIAGLGGGDVIKGLGGGDSICGGNGSDKLIGGDRGDALAGEAGNDALSGGGGSDFFFGGPGNDTFNGGAGIDDTATYFLAPSGVQADLAAGTATGEGTDTLTGIDDLEGSRFDDTLTGDPNWNFFFPGDGNDLVVGGGDTRDLVNFFFSPNPVVVDLTGGTAAGEGTDTLTGIGQVFGSRHDDMIDGGDGTDTCTSGETVTTCEA